MKKQMIADMRPGDGVETQALVLEAQRTPYSAPHRSGEHFLRLVFGDVSGRIKAVMWDPPREDELVASGDVVFLRGSVGDYHGPQVVVSEMRRLDPKKVNRAFFQPVSQRPPEEMQAELKQALSDVGQGPLGLLLESFFGDASFNERFALAPAARTVHHNWVGGLLEHTLEVVRFSRELCALSGDRLRLDLLLAGALLHDVGKVEEYDADSPGFAFTDRGRLLGHVSMGRDMLRERAAALADFPPDLLLELEHMLLSHHGQREWGSPEVPKTAHAFALFHADLVSARMNQLYLVMDRHDPRAGAWTPPDRFLERSIFLGPEEGTA